MDKQNIGVFGGGSWATAIVKMLLANLDDGQQINWYIRNKDAVQQIKNNKRNPNYLSSVELDVEKINLSSKLKKVVEKSEILIFAIPSAYLDDAIRKENLNFKGKTIVSAIKGIVPEKNLIVGEYFNQIHHVPLESLVIIAGPCHAEEVALERLSYLTIASLDMQKAEQIANALDSKFLKTFISDDIYGTEYSAVLKNIFALAAGICHGLGYGDNFQSVLIANAIQEIKRFVDTVHPIERDIKSSAYLGDLMVTSYSKFSRNRTFGNMIGKGYSVKSAQLEMNMVAEGYFATKSIYEINKKFNIFMPISEAIYNILYNGKPAAFEIKLLTDKIR